MVIDYSYLIGSDVYSDGKYFGRITSLKDGCAVIDSDRRIHVTVLRDYEIVEPQDNKVTRHQTRQEVRTLHCK
jgi:hypothetical protein